MKTVTIYTDGACSGNPGPGGWAAILEYNGTEKMISGGEESTTNNRMELTAVISALLALKEPPMRILFLLARQFNLLLQVKELQRLGCDQKMIASRTGLQSFVVRNYTGCTGRYTTAQLRQAVEDFTQTEEEVKTGRLSDVLSVELLIVKYARKNPV